jgi:hypothetical protein
MNPREWMEASYNKNKKYLADKGLRQPSIDFSRYGLLIGKICLNPITQSMDCFAANDEVLGESLLNLAIKINNIVISKFGNTPSIDKEGLDRIEVAIANRMLLGLGVGDAVQKWDVPFDAFPSYISHSSRQPEERIAAQILWGLLGVFENKIDQYEKAIETSVKSHPDLNQEIDLLRLIVNLSSNPNDSNWSSFEKVLARWLNPILRLDSNATLFREDFAMVLVLFWCKFKAQRLDRDYILNTYFGETLTIRVHVN